MSTPSIYGEYAQYLPNILQEITDPIIAANIASKKETGFKLYEHFISRIKESDSMREKCRRKNLPETSQSALKEIRDSIGIRIVCGFVDDIYKTIEVIKAIPVSRSTMRRIIFQMPSLTVIVLITSFWK